LKDYIVDTFKEKSSIETETRERFLKLNSLSIDAQLDQLKLDERPGVIGTVYIMHVVKVDDPGHVEIEEFELKLTPLYVQVLKPGQHAMSMRSPRRREKELTEIDE
jgi:hypothetical protein